MLYKGENRVETVREQGQQRATPPVRKSAVTNLLPSNGSSAKPSRKQVPVSVWPSVSLVARHHPPKDFHPDRHYLWVGDLWGPHGNHQPRPAAVVQIDRFLDSPPRSRNRRWPPSCAASAFCERGSGVVKVVGRTELCRLPAPLFETTGEHTTPFSFTLREFREMDKTRPHPRACYLHACLRYVQRDIHDMPPLGNVSGSTKNNP